MRSPEKQKKKGKEPTKGGGRFNQRKASRERKLKHHRGRGNVLNTPGSGGRKKKGREVETPKRLPGRIEGAGWSQ